MPLFAPLTTLPDYGNPVNRSAPITQGLVSWWKCLPQRLGGARWLDLASTNHGTLITLQPSSSAAGWAPTSRPGGFGELRCDGTGYIDCGTSSALNPVAITLSIWVKGANWTPSYSAVFARIYAGGDPNAFHSVLVRSDGKLACFVSTNITTTLSYDGTGAATLSPGTWYHVALTYDSVSGLSGYVNGVLDATVAANGLLAQKAGVTTALGTDLNIAGRTLTGALDDARLWARALSASEIRQLTREGLLRAPRALRTVRPLLLGPNSLSRTSTGAAAANTTRVAAAARSASGQSLATRTAVTSAPRSSLGSASQGSVPVASNVLPRTESATGAAQGVASQSRPLLAQATETALRVAGATTTATGHAQETLGRLASAVRSALGSQTGMPSGVAHALRTSLVQAAALQSSVRSASATRQARATASTQFVRSALQTLSVQALAVAIAQVTAAQQALSVTAANTLASMLSQARLVPASAQASTARLVATNLRLSRGSASDALQAHPHVAHTLSAEASASLTALLSEALVAHGHTTSVATGLAAGVVTRVLVAQGLLQLTNSATLTLPQAASGLSTPVAQAQRTLVGQAQALVARTVLANVRLSRGHAVALGHTVPVISWTFVRRAIAMARVEVVGRFEMGGEIHVVGPGNRRLQTIYPWARPHIYYYPLRRH